MLKFLFKGLASSLALGVLSNYRHLSVKLLKIETAKSYLHGVKMARLTAISLLQAVLMIALIVLGVLLFHAGLFILLPWTVKAKALLGVCLGLIYVICGAVLLRAATSEKTWMEKSGAAQMLKEVTETGN